MTELAPAFVWLPFPSLRQHSQRSDPAEARDAYIRYVAYIRSAVDDHYRRQDIMACIVSF